MCVSELISTSKKKRRQGMKHQTSPQNTCSEEKATITWKVCERRKAAAAADPLAGYWSLFSVQTDVPMKKLDSRATWGLATDEMCSFIIIGNNVLPLWCLNIDYWVYFHKLCDTTRWLKAFAVSEIDCLACLSVLSCWSYFRCGWSWQPWDRRSADVWVSQ